MSQLLELHVAGEVYREKAEESLTTYLKQQSQIAKVAEANSAELASIEVTSKSFERVIRTRPKLKYRGDWI